MADKTRGEHIEVIMRKLKPASASGGKYPALEPGITVEDGIRIERDVAVKMRDGVTVYTDIYRPDGETKLPAIVAWSPYGKRAGYAGGYLPGTPVGFIPGVPMGTCSAGTKFEGPDPGFWCKCGYAVINPDARGAGNSEGDVRFWSNAEGEDCHDLIEWLGTRDWSNGKVGMTGNSWLAIAQWFAAAEQPPHLTCIAPWEGITDFYRDLICRGGVPETGFWDLVYHGQCGPNGMEDVVAMVRKYPFMNSYWEAKIAHLDKINIPAYVTAGWNHFHLHGCFDGFRNIRSEKKWMRAHREFEWPDTYTPANLDDLKRFFDRYLKGIRNGWDMTPKVRIEVMDYGETAWQVNRPEKEFPLARTQYEKLYVDTGAGKLSLKPLAKEASTRYEAAKGLANFDIKFDQETELTGYMKLRLWMEADGSDDMDIFVAIQKLDAKGNLLPTMVLGKPHPGSTGLLRASHRELDESKSTPSEPHHPHTREQLLKPKEIVPLEIGIWPSSRIWHAGEQLRVVVSGHYVREPGWFEPFLWEVRNKGQHIIHAGGKYDSHLLVPRIPAKGLLD